jgi:hypothetical protein
VQIRWQRLTRDLVAEDGPAVEVVPAASLPGALPYYERSRISEQEYRARIAGRQAAVASRMLG